MSEYYRKTLTRPPMPGAELAPEAPAVGTGLQIEIQGQIPVEFTNDDGAGDDVVDSPPAEDTSVEARLRAAMATGAAVDVEWDRGGPGDDWYSPTDSHPFGFGGVLTDVAREHGRLHADTDYGYRFYIPEDREVRLGCSQMQPYEPPAVVETGPSAVAIPDPTPQYPDEDRSAADVLGDTSPYARWKYAVLTSGEQEPFPKETPPAGEPQFMYLAGTAGTGKTYLARLRSLNYDDAMLCATTGIAAVNLGGTTINSVLRYYDTASMQTEYEFGRLGVALKQMARSGYTRLIVDEVSMMDGLQLDILLLAVDELNEWLMSEHKPLLGITLVGDFAQLPPVKAPFVFQRPGWERFEPHTLMLMEPRRQADPDFVRALQAVRRGDMAAADYFRPLIQPAEILDFDGSSILATNIEVDRVNQVRMLKLAGPESTFRAVRTGEQSQEWKNIPDVLTLKKEALVMCLANYRDPDTKEFVYANGDLGHFLEPVVPGHPDSPARVRLQRNGQEVTVQRVGRDYGKPTGNTGDKAPRMEKKGSISYLPLRVAYGTTVHKSQGLSLDNVQLMINSRFWMQSGMLYVALSRARTPQGLKIIGSIDQFRARIRTNPLITRWL